MIIQKNDWSSIHWTDLFGLEYVKADSYVRAVDTPWYQSDRTTALSRNDTFNYISQQSAYINSSFKLSWFYNADEFDTTVIRGGYWEVPFYVQAQIIRKDTNVGVSRCYRWNQSSAGAWYCADVSNYNSTESDYVYPQLVVQVIAVYKQGYTDICNVDLQNNKIHCPVATFTNLTGIASVQVKTNVYYSTDNTDTYSYYVGLGRKVNQFSPDSSAIINNQNQIANQTITTITDSNTTEANTTASNFFSNFTDTDNGGISSIITAPLQAISGLVSAQCVQIELPIPYLDNKTLILPCMSSIYQQHFGQLFTLYQTIIFGAIAYRMLVSLFMMIQGFKNPDDDKIEVVDL